MTSILAIGTPQKWVGINVTTATNNLDSFLWKLDHQKVMKLLDKKEDIYKLGLEISEKRLYTNKDIAKINEVCIYDIFDNINILTIKKIKAGYSDDAYIYELVDRYNLKEPEPNWDKINILNELIWRSSINATNNETQKQINKQKIKA